MFEPQHVSGQHENWAAAGQVQTWEASFRVHTLYSGKRCLKPARLAVHRLEPGQAIARQPHGFMFGSGTDSVRQFRQ